MERRSYYGNRRDSSAGGVNAHSAERKKKPASDKAYGPLEGIRTHHSPTNISHRKPKQLWPPISPPYNPHRPASYSHGHLDSESHRPKRPALATVNPHRTWVQDEYAIMASSSSPAANQQTTTGKISLGPRAAELKKRLRLNLQANRARPSSPMSSNQRHQLSAPVHSHPSQARPRKSFVPHALPQEPSQKTVPATVKDIADLISDIQASTDDLPDYEDTLAPDGPGIMGIPQSTQSLPPKEPSHQPMPCFIEKPDQQAARDDHTIQSSQPNGKLHLMSAANSYTNDKHSPVKNTVPEVKTSTVLPGALNIKAGDKNHPNETINTQTASNAPPNELNYEPTNERHIQSTQKEIQTRSQDNKVTEGVVGLGTEDTKKEGTRKEEATTTLSQFVVYDQDLRDWLEFTNYHDVEYRKKTLERRRNLVKLLQEEEMASGAKHLPLPPVPVTPSIEGRPQTMRASEKPRENTKTTSQDDDNAVPKGAKDSQTTAFPNPTANAKRPNKEGQPGPRKKQNRAEGPNRYGARRRDFNYDDRPSTYHARPHPRSLSPRRSPSRYRDDYIGHRRERSPGPRYASVRYEDYDEPVRGGRYNYDRGQRERDYGQRGDRDGFLRPNRPNLGTRGETRFFLIKSFNDSSVKKCVKHGIWTTQVQNGQVLAEAYRDCEKVILFFSVNGSKAFQGYARMASAPSADIARMPWMKTIHWESSPPFRVEWLNTCQTEFFRVNHLHNKYNEGLVVLIGKDGQEMDESCGKALAAEMDKVAEAKRGLWSRRPATVKRAPSPPLPKKKNKASPASRAEDRCEGDEETGEWWGKVE